MCRLFLLLLSKGNRRAICFVLVVNVTTRRFNHLVQRIIPNSPASFTAIQLNEVLVTSSSSVSSSPPSAFFRPLTLFSTKLTVWKSLYSTPTRCAGSLLDPQVQHKNILLDFSPSLILAPPGSSVRLLLSLTGHVTLKRTQFVRAPPSSPPRALPQPVSSPCFPANAMQQKKNFSGEGQEDC